MARKPGGWRALHRCLTIAGVAALSAACTKPSASGKVDEVVVVTSNEIWAALEEDIVAALEPSAFTVRRERIFEVAYLGPDDVRDSRLRRMRQVLLIGSAREPIVVEALGDRAEEARRPVIIQARDVWALNQVVTVVLLPDSAEPRALAPLLPRLRDVLVRQLEIALRARIALSPANEQRTERIRREAGFTLLVPSTYDLAQPEPGVFVFRREEWAAGPVVRTITVGSRDRAAVEWTAGGASRWRAELARRLNEPAHVTDTLTRALRGTVAGQPVVQVQGVWTTPPGEWPAAGPFIARMVECPQRVFLVDAWVYAPADEKYEHVYRLDAVLDSFECPTDGRE
ncbi:MAG: DUF4837 family protein [Gemmatimonadota bacterium]